MHWLKVDLIFCDTWWPSYLFNGLKLLNEICKILDVYFFQNMTVNFLCKTFPASTFLTTYKKTYPCMQNNNKSSKLNVNYINIISIYWHYSLLWEAKITLSFDPYLVIVVDKNIYIKLWTLNMYLTIICLTSISYKLPGTKKRVIKIPGK